jgi:hypothetical protein
MVFSPYILEIYFVFTHYQTNSLAWNQSWKATSLSVSKEIRSILQEQQVYHHVHKSPRIHSNSKCSSTIRTQGRAVRLHASIHSKVWIIRPKLDGRRITQLEMSDNKEHKWKRLR